MAAHQIAASALIHVPPQDLYAIIADYHQGHPQILPKPPFVSLAVEQGGTGTGTVIRVHMRVLGRLHMFLRSLPSRSQGVSWWKRMTTGMSPPSQSSAMQTDRLPMSRLSRRCRDVLG